MLVHSLVLPLVYCDSCRIISHLFLGTGMVLNEEKSNRLAEVIARRQGALDGAGGSAPSSPTPTPLEKNKGVVAIDSDEDTK